MINTNNIIEKMKVKTKREKNSTSHPQTLNKMYKGKKETEQNTKKNKKTKARTTKIKEKICLHHNKLKKKQQRDGQHHNDHGQKSYLLINNSYPFDKENKVIMNYHPNCHYRQYQY